VKRVPGDGRGCCGTPGVDVGAAVGVGMGVTGAGAEEERSVGQVEVRPLAGTGSNDTMQHSYARDNPMASSNVIGRWSSTSMRRGSPSPAVPSQRVSSLRNWS
jgi:hypothetical protein